ncbi:MAG: TRAP transporter small permease [Treponema sp.]|nr:TRAP transporter small permease [Candidatus Treponema equifaecale]
MASISEKIKGFFSSIPGEICKPGYKAWEKAISAVTFVFDCIYRVLLEFSKIVLLFIVIIVSAQVFCRFFKHSIMWSEEVALLLMVWTAFIALAIGVEKGLHIAITIFYNMFPKKLQWVISKLILLSTIFFGFILIYYGAKVSANGMKNMLPATQWPNGIKFLMMPVGGVFVCYFAVLDLFGLGKYRHLDIEDGNRGEDKTDQQILEEAQQNKNAASETTEE